MGMDEILARHKASLIALVGLVLPLFLLYTHGRHPRRTTIVEVALIRLTAPVQSAAAQALSGVSDVWGGYMALVGTAEENAALREENARARLGLTRMAELEAENERLRTMLEFRKARRDLILAGAHVIGKDVSPYARVLRIAIDAGVEEGVEEGMPVIAPTGLVGRVARVDGSYAEITLTADAQSTVNVKCRDKGVTGTVTGTGAASNYVSRFSYLHRSEALAVGDVLVTSGHDKAFPPGLVVGTIRSIEERQRALEYELEVSPSVNFADLEEVYVVVGVLGAVGAGGPRALGADGTGASGPSTSAPGPEAPSSGQPAPGQAAPSSLQPASPAPLPARGGTPPAGLAPASGASPGADGEAP
jgi:rod shape-determining protein MreC